jgi:hypothetical protein
MDNITKSLAQAYKGMYEAKGVEKASWVPESIADEDVSHFMGAAAAASKAGKSHFEFGGKKYKVTMKKDAAKKISEAEESEEKLDEEALDEISKGAAQRYYSKASKSQSAAMSKLIKSPSGSSDHKSAQKTLKKRDGGLKKATNRLLAPTKEDVDDIDEISLGLATKTHAARKSRAQGAMHQGNKTYAKSQMAKAKKTKSYIQKREETEVDDYTKLNVKESPEQPRAKGEKDFKDMHKVTMGADEDELHKKDMEAIKKSVDAIKKKPQPKGTA